jgi:hypothetical protein
MLHGRRVWGGGVEGKAEGFQAPCASGTIWVPRCEALVFVHSYTCVHASYTCVHNELEGNLFGAIYIQINVSSQICADTQLSPIIHWLTMCNQLY